MNKFLLQHLWAKSALIIIIFLIPFASLAQTKNGSITGTVLSVSGQPVVMASVLLKGTKLGTHTSESGYFQLENLRAGTYRLHVSEVGFKRLDTAVTVKEGTATIINVTLAESSSDLVEVNITGARHGATKTVSPSLRLNTPLIETPQNITVTGIQTIKNIGALSLSDILRTSSGILAGGAKQDISFNVRGTQVYSSILRNGIGSGYWYNQEADASMIERVEFIKGPAGFMISNTEPGGLVNIVTKQPTHERTAQFGFGLGSWNLMRSNVDLGGELNKSGNLTYRLNAGLQRQADFYKFSEFNKSFVAAAVKYEFDDKTSVTAEYNYMQARSLSNGQVLPTINGKFFVLPDNFGAIDPNVPGTKSADNYYRVQLSHKLDDKWHVNAQAGAASGPWGGYMMYTEGTSPTYDTLYRYMAYTGWKNKLYTVQAFLDGSFNTGSKVEHKVLLGIDYGNTSVHSSGGDTYGDRSRNNLLFDSLAYYIPVDSLKNFSVNGFDSKYGSRYAALYIQDHIKFYDKFIVTLAARYTGSVSWANYSDPVEQSDNKLVPRFGLTYLITNNISVYGLYDGAFIAQNGRSFSGEVFKPLTGNNKEFGVKGVFFDRFNASAAVYQITKNNALTTDPEHPAFQIQSGQLISKGVEFDVNGNILPNLNMFANYAYTDARITKDNNPVLVGIRNSGAVKHTANLFGRYSFTHGAVKGFSLGAGMQYSGQISGGLNYNDMTFAGYLPSYTLFDASAGYTYKKMSVNVNVYNLTNKRYASGGYRSVGDDWNYNVGTPQNFRLSVGFAL
ncbi:TonB-dependent siderophore receptor [Mucilaginibacter gynuensis]|uniref:TonB-dependent siderophore receptor n=1 Tax=Mucilaginibacter gynuensis TaxID=1302236 RepID=A0ABP8G9K4_9SPHI